MTPKSDIQVLKPQIFPKNSQTQVTKLAEPHTEFIS